MSEKLPVTLEKLTTEEFLLNMGPQHPSTHGVLRIVLKLDGEVVNDIVPVCGYIHRGMEKMFENRKYDQIIPFTDRTDYLSAINNNFAYVIAVEKLMGITPPLRAEYMRVILSELNRIMSHILWLSAYGMDMGAFTPLLYLFREREEVLAMIEMMTGNRLTHNAFRIGGFKYDIPEGFFRKLEAFTGHFNDKIQEYETLLINNVIFKSRTVGVGVINKEKAISYGFTGPSLRGSDAKIDLRRDAPYSVYQQLDFEIPSGRNGDTWDRCKVRMDEMRQSVHILKQAMRNIPEGDIITKVPKIIKIPPGEYYGAVEGPRGEVGFYIVSDGSNKPYRVKMRVPSFSNLSGLRDMVIGLKLADIVAVMGSLDLVIPEIDR
jgi:NADH-quinone oxidoreductase subunit D